MSFVPGFKAPAHRADGSLWFVFRNGKLLIKPAQDGCMIPGPSELAGLGLAPDRSLYLGELDGRCCYAATLEQRPELPDTLEWRDLRALFGTIAENLLWVAGRANQLMDWDRSHRFCGRCGSPNQDKTDERAKQCPQCGLVNYPRLSPAVIVAVLRDDRILLARNKNFRMPMFSVLAGFVEPGETLEACVEREIQEEVGIRVANIRYFGSQPWPFPNSLMIGFVADHAGGEITLGDGEIAEAGWFDRSNLPPIPSPVSIARRLIDWYVASPR